MTTHLTLKIIVAVVHVMAILLNRNKGAPATTGEPAIRESPVPNGISG